MVLLELMVRVQLYGHLPDIVVDAADAGSNGAVVALELVQAYAAQVTGIHGSVAPQQQASAVLVPGLDGRCGGLYVCRHCEYFRFTDAFQVTQPE